MNVSGTQPAAAGGRRQFLAFGAAGMLAGRGLLARAGSADEPVPGNTAIELIPATDRCVRISYKSSIDGVLSTPDGQRQTVLSVVGSSQFEFDQLQQGGAAQQLEGMRLSRRYRRASVNTRVGRGHETSTVLPSGTCLMHVYGNDGQLVQLSPEVRLTRSQLDLLQFPCDPAGAAGLLPGRSLAAADEKWNADPWVFPLLTGMDAAISQSVSGKILELSEQEAKIGFECRGSGAVTGSATEVTLTGTLLFDRKSLMIRRFDAVIDENRSAGPVGPGLKVKASISWTQDPADVDGQLSALIPAGFPESGRLLLTLVTPWRLVLLHDRRWHVFQETADLVILRMLTNGALTAQCNLAAAPQMPAGRFTEEGKFLSEIEQKISPWKGAIVDSSVESDRQGWRVHHVRAEAEVQPAVAGAALASNAGANGAGPAAAEKSAEKRSLQKILWDYYLCTAKSGEQFSMVFSHAAEDAAEFSGVPDQFLSRMSIRAVRPVVPLPR